MLSFRCLFLKSVYNLVDTNSLLITTRKSSVTYYKRFHQGIRWNLSGSIFYESLKILHQIFLLKSISIPEYGQIGTTFSIIYLAINLSSAGAFTSIPPFTKIFTQSKKAFRISFGIYFIIQATTLSLASLTIALLYTNNVLPSSKHLNLYIPLFIIVTEGLRMLLRSFLHTIFQNKTTILIDTVLFISYLASVWTPYALFNRAITLNLIFKPYLIISLLGFILFAFTTLKTYKNLPEEETTLPKNLWRRIFKARSFNYFTRVTKHIFTGNFLVPLFAARFGFATAGIFKFASYLADSIKGIIHVTVGFSGGALLAALKASNLKEKQLAFYTLSEKLNKLLAFIVIFVTFNLKSFQALNRTLYDPFSVLMFILFFLFITLLDNLFIVYDQFYIIEEQSDKIFGFKLIELLMFTAVIYFGGNLSALFIVSNLILVRTLSFGIIATNAYSLWRIAPRLKINKQFLIIAIIISGIFSYLINLVT